MIYQKLDLNNNGFFDMSKIIIDVNPKCIDWLLKAYPKIQITVEGIENWKSEKPTLAKVRALAKEVQRPIAFFLSEPKIKPETVGGINNLDTRTILSEKIDINYKIVVLSEELQKRRQDYLQVATAIDIDVMPKFTIFKEKDKVSIIEYIINFIYPPDKKIYALKAKDIYNYIIKKIEDLNILIFKIPSQKDKSLRGLALYHDILPIIGIASNDSIVGQIFSIIHELVHVLLKSSMIHNTDTDKYEFASIEKLCNEITGKVLLQDNAIYNDPIITQLIRLEKQELNINYIENIANHYKISRDVVLRRLLDKKIIPKDTYDNLLSVLKEKQKKMDDKPSGGGKDTHLYTTINQFGMKYCKAIYHGWERGVISKSDLYYYLGRKDKYCIEIMNKIAAKFNK